MSLSVAIYPTEDVISQFAKASTQKNVRFFKLVLEDEKIVVAGSQPPSSSVIDDYAKIQGYFNDFEACYVLFHFELEEANSWALLRFVSERAKVKDKMLYSSSTENIYSSLGKMNFSYALNGVEKDQMTLNIFVEQNIRSLSPSLKQTLGAYVNAITSSNLADEKERELLRREKLEHISSLTREEQQIREEARMETVASGSSSIAFPVDPGCSPVLAQFLDKKINFVELSIINETLTITKTLPTLPPQQISTTIDSALPHFYLVAYQHSASPDGLATLFIFSCPTGCPVRPRMAYSMGKGSTMEVIKAAGITVTKTIESQEAARDLTVDQINDILSTLASEVAASPPPSSSPNGAAVDIKNTRAGAGGRPSQRTFTRTPQAAPAAQNADLMSGLKQAVKVNLSGQ